jgi:hypothetical protein
MFVLFQQNTMMHFFLCFKVKWIMFDDSYNTLRVAWHFANIENWNGRKKRIFVFWKKPFVEDWACTNIMHERMTVMKYTHFLKQQCADSLSSPIASIRVPDNEKNKKKESRIVKAMWRHITALLSWMNVDPHIWREQRDEESRSSETMKVEEK